MLSSNQNSQAGMPGLTENEAAFTARAGGENMQTSYTDVLMAHRK